MDFSNMQCTWCKTAIVNPTKGQKAVHYRCGRMYCSKECSGAYKGASSSATMAKTNRKHASARMKANNPMFNSKSLDKMKKTLSDLGLKPKVRGGNGTGLTKAERTLADATGLRPYTVQTGMKRGSGYSTHYKLDLADPTRMLGIEIDGRSHQALARQAQDKKKEDFLKSLGWTILRFTNEQALHHTAECVKAIGG